MKNLLKFSLIFFTFIIAGCSSAKSMVTVGDSYQCQAEIADNAISHAIGLSGRLQLAESECMLFLYDDAKPRNYWMKGMNFPIDIIFMRDNEVVEIRENMAVPNNGQVPKYTSGEATDMVLEVPAGTARKYGLEVGYEVDRQ